jgi:polysaccharide export outer membrane protein
MTLFWILIFLLSAACSHLPQLSKFDASTYSGRTVLGPSDVVDIRVFDEKELSGVYQINSDGTLRLPLVGVVKISGLAPDEAAQKIASEFGEKYLKNPQVIIFVQQFNSRKIYLLGEVKAPGPYTYEENMTVIAAVAKAGGTTAYAAANKTIVTRNVGGKLQKYTARVADMGRGDAGDLPIMPGDVIFVPQSLF